VTHQVGQLVAGGLLHGTMVPWQSTV